MKKKKGSTMVGAMISIFILLLVISGFSYAKVEVNKSVTAKATIKDGVDFSNLAAAVANTNEYGTNHNLVVTDENISFDKYKASLKDNLKLDDSFNPIGDSFIKGKVKIINFIIYNVRNADVEVITWSGNGFTKINYVNSKGNIKTPNGVIIENSSIYSKIEFPLVLLREKEFFMEESLVDIIKN